MASSIPLIIIGLAFIWIMYPAANSCYGVGEVFIGLALCLAYGILLLCMMLVGVVRHHRFNKPFNRIPYITTAVLVILFTLSNRIGEIHSKNVLTASDQSGSNTRLALRKNNMCKLEKRYVEYGCYMEVQYSIIHDTLELGDFSKHLNGYFAQRYIIDKTSNQLQPINNTGDSTRYEKLMIDDVPRE